MAASRKYKNISSSRRGRQQGRSELADWRQAAKVEANLRREFYGLAMKFARAVERYGLHLDACPQNGWDNDPRYKCTCGFNEIRKLAREQIK